MNNTGKKLLVVSTSFPQKPGDGLSPFILELCQNLAGRGWPVTALVPHAAGLADSEIWGNVTVRRFRYLPDRFEDLGYSGGILPNVESKPWKLVKVPFFVLAMYREALRLTTDEGFDVVCFQWFYPAAFWLGQFKRSTGASVILTGHGTDIHLAAKNPPFRFFAGRAFKRVSAITVNSEYMKSLLPQAMLPKRTAVIPMGVDTGKFTPAGNRPSQSKTIIYVGRLIRQKGINLLIEAFADVAAAVPDARLEIIGYGPEREAILQMMQSRGIGKNVTLIDMVPHDSLPDIYRRARVLVLPSLIPEGLGMTPAEAGLCGVPAVTFGLGGTGEIVIDGRTGIIPELSAVGLRDALLRIMQDDALADRLGDGAREFLPGKIGWESIAEKFDALFSEAAAEAAPLGRGRASTLATGIIIMATVLYVAKLLFDRFERLMSLIR